MLAIFSPSSRCASDLMSQFYYKKRAVLFLLIGFVLQMIGDLVG